MEERIKKQLEMIESGDIKGFIDDIDQMSASKAYIIIRDNINYQHVKKIKDSGDANYQKFQDIKLRAKQSWDYDHKSATMEDVNRGCMNVYMLILKIMRAQNDDLADELNKIKTVINKIENKVGIEHTVLYDEISINGGNDDVGNVQGVKKDI